MDKTTTQRPTIGQQVRITGKVQRRKNYSRPRIVTWHEEAQEATGVFMGYRTVYEGYVYNISEDEGNAFIPEKHFEVWLIVTNPRHNPLKCRPEQVIVEETA